MSRQDARLSRERAADERAAQIVADAVARVRAQPEPEGDQDDES